MTNVAARGGSPGPGRQLRDEQLALRVGAVDRGQERDQQSDQAQAEQRLEDLDQA